MTARVLLTVSGTVPQDLDERVAAGRRPRADYVELAEAFAADLLDYEGARSAMGRFGAVVERLGGANVLLAWACHRRRHRYDVIVSDGEQVGIPLAALSWFGRRRPRHVMIAHLMSPPKKQVVFRALGLRRRIDRILVYATAQRRVVVERLKVRPERVHLTPFMVDTRFFRPTDGQTASPPVLSSAGLEFRDYPTLIGAVRDLDVRVVLAAASPWSKRADTSEGVDLPANVEVRRLDHYDLRELYARSALVVVPVVETDFQAGITTILEAMAMGKPLVCTRTEGQTDTVIDGVTGIYVPPGDVGAMRAAIEDLLGDPERAARLGAAAREWVVANGELDVYCERLAAIVDAVRAEAG